MPTTDREIANKVRAAVRDFNRECDALAHRGVVVDVELITDFKQLAPEPRVQLKELVIRKRL